MSQITIIIIIIIIIISGGGGGSSSSSSSSSSNSSSRKELDIPFIDIKLIEHNVQSYCGLMKTLGVSH